MNRVCATLRTIQTPCLLLDEGRLRSNINRLRMHVGSRGVKFRPHLKTVKSLEIADLMVERPEGGATVSTLQEAEAYADRGLLDLVYAVGIDPNKLERVITLRQRGVDLVLTLDSVEQANAVVAAGRRTSRAIPALIEIDVDGHRGGVRPDSASLLEVAAALSRPGAELRGVLAHAGESYHLVGQNALQAAAEQECTQCFAAAERLRAAGYTCSIVSIGSTPTVLSAREFPGVTPAQTPLVQWEWIKPGCHISAMGADQLGKCELARPYPPGVRLFADYPAQSIRIGEFQGLHPEPLSLGAVLAESVPRRLSETDITVFDSSGLSIQDLAVAAAAVDRYQERCLANK